MNIDENLRKIVVALLRKWKVIVLFAVIGALVGYFYTANFVELTYSSKVEFLAYAEDTNSELQEAGQAQASSDNVRTSNTSKMNYAMKMLDTYIEIMNTNEFTNRIAQDMNDRMNSSYTGSTIKSAMSIEGVENTAMFKITVSTNSADLSYEIAHQLELSVPEMMKETNSGLVQASVEDKPIKASAAGSLGYAKKCAIAAVIGVVIAAAYIILRNLLDVRIRTSEELIEKYNIPVLGSIPSFELKSSNSNTGSTSSTKEEKTSTAKAPLEAPAESLKERSMKGDEE